MASKNDSDRVNLYVVLTVDGSGGYTSFADAKRWSGRLFGDYELRDCANVRLAAPADSDIRWDYRDISTTKKEAIAILKEPYVAEVDLMKQPAGCDDYACPGPKYYGITCDSLALKPASAYFTFSISLTRLGHNPPCYSDKSSACPETEEDPPNRKLLRKWTYELFSKYDLRSASDSTRIEPVPVEAELFWYYGNFKATASTLLTLVKETYVDQIMIYDLRNIPTVDIVRIFENPKIGFNGARFDLKGRSMDARKVRGLELRRPAIPQSGTARPTTPRTR